MCVSARGGGQIPHLARNNSSVVNQPGCVTLHVEEEAGVRGEGGRPGFELTPGCKWMFLPPFLWDRALCVCVRRRASERAPDREVFMSPYKILGRALGD